MIQYIQNLLYLHDCVIIPEFGAFITNYQHAVIDKHQNKIAPPKKSIAFNKLLNSNDGLLISHVKEQENCSYTEAQIKVQQFVDNCKQTLSKQQALLFKSIGRFYLDQEQNWIFEPDTTSNYLLDTFGLPTLSIYPIKRLTAPNIKKEDNLIVETTKISNSKKYKVEQTAKPFKSYWLATFLAIVLIATIASLSISKINNKNIVWASMFDYFKKDNITLNSSTPTNIDIEENTSNITAEKSTNTVVDKVASVEVDSISIATVIENNTEPIEIIKYDSYILIGSFLDEANALKLQKETNAKAFQTVIEHKGALYRVLITTSFKQVHETLQEVKVQLNSRAYIYCVKCNI